MKICIQFSFGKKNKHCLFITFILRQGTRLSEIIINKSICGEIKILKANKDFVKDIPKGDFKIDKMTFISKEKQNIYLYNLEYGKDIFTLSKETNIVDFASKHPFVLVLQAFRFSVLNQITKEICFQKECSEQLISTSSNYHVVSILDTKNMIQIYNWKGKILQNK
jgi:hypothetical protein